MRVLRAWGTALRPGALRRARGELPELLRLVLSGRARGAPARRGGRADRSADHRPGRARVRPAHRRALRLRLPGRVPRGGAPARGTSGASGSIGCSIASRACSSPARTASWRWARRCASGSWPARTPIPGASRSSTTGRIARPSSPDRSAIRGRSPTAWPSRSSSCTPAISASPRISTSSSMPPRGSPHIPTSSSPSSATG